MKPAEGSTVIGRSVTIRGELSGKEDLFMDGVVEGTIALLEGRLTVGPNARVMADVQAREVVIYRAGGGQYTRDGADRVARVGGGAGRPVCGEAVD